MAAAIPSASVFFIVFLLFEKQIV